MTKLSYAGSYRDLVVYQKARLLAHEIFQLSTSFPKEEMYSLTDPIRRCSRSIGAQIAAAWAKRRYEKHFVSKLTDADSKPRETQHWLETALDCGYLNLNQCTELLQRGQEIARLLQGMIDKAELFCAHASSPIREAQAGYFVPSA